MASFIRFIPLPFKIKVKPSDIQALFCRVLFFHAGRMFCPSTGCALALAGRVRWRCGSQCGAQASKNLWHGEKEPFCLLEAKRPMQNSQVTAVIRSSDSQLFPRRADESSRAAPAPSEP